MACSIALNYGYDYEAWGISTACLQGPKFSEVQQKAKQLGHDINVPRHVYMTPPPDVWRILHKLAPQHFPRAEDAWNSILEMLKAAYGLVDAPLLWQGQLSKFEEHFITWLEGDLIVLCLVIYVDDIFAVGRKDWIAWALYRIEQRFGNSKETHYRSHM